MTKEQVQAAFSKIIWDAEISNLTLSEYLDANPEIEEEWVQLEKECERLGVSPFELAHK